VQTVALFSDYELGKNDVLNESVITNIENFTPDDLSHLIMAKNVLNEETLEKIEAEATYLANRQNLN